MCIEADCQEHSVYASYLVDGPVLWSDAWNCLALHPCHNAGSDLTVGIASESRRKGCSAPFVSGVVVDEKRMR